MKFVLAAFSLIFPFAVTANAASVCVSQDSSYSFEVSSPSNNLKSLSKFALNQCRQMSSSPSECYVHGCEFAQSSYGADLNAALAAIPGRLPPAPMELRYQGVTGIPAGSKLY